MTERSEAGKIAELLNRCLENRRNKLRKQIEKEDPDLYAAMLRCEELLAKYPDQRDAIIEAFEEEPLPPRDNSILGKMKGRGHKPRPS